MPRTATLDLQARLDAANAPLPTPDSPQAAYEQLRELVRDFIDAKNDDSLTREGREEAIFIAYTRLKRAVLR